MAATSISRTRKQEQSVLACVCVLSTCGQGISEKIAQTCATTSSPRSDPKKGYTVCIRHSLSIKTAPQFHSDWPAFKIREPQTPDQLPHSKQSSRTSNVFTSILTQKQPNSSKLKLQQPYLWCLQSAPVFVTSFRVMAINCATALEDFFFQLFNSLAPELCIQRQTSQQLQSMTKHEQSCNLFKAREVKSSIGGLLLQMVWFFNEDRANDEHNYKRTRLSTAKSSPFRPHLSSFLLRIVPWAAWTENDHEKKTSHRPNCL